MALHHGMRQTCMQSFCSWVWLGCEVIANLIRMLVSELPRILLLYRGLDVHGMIVAHVQVLNYCCTLHSMGSKMSASTTSTCPDSYNRREQHVENAAVVRKSNCQEQRTYLS